MIGNLVVSGLMAFSSPQDSTDGRTADQKEIFVQDIGYPSWDRYLADFDNDTLKVRYTLGTRLLDAAERDNQTDLYRLAYTLFAYLYGRYETLDDTTKKGLGEDMERLMINGAGKLGDERFEYEAVKKAQDVIPSEALKKREEELERILNPLPW